MMACSRLVRACLGNMLRARSIYTNAVVLSPIQIQMPALSPTMEEGTIIKWLVGEGDSVEVGDALCEVETDKAVVTMEASEDGTIARILVPEGTSHVKISVPIAILAEEGEDLKEASKMDVSVDLPEQPVASQAPMETTASLKDKDTKTFNLRLSPAVRQILQRHDIESNKISGSGRNGLILKGDVLQYITANNIQPKNFTIVPSTKETLKPATQPTVKKETSAAAATTTGQPTKAQHADGDYSDVEMSNVRKVIAKRLTASKQQIPHAYVSIECVISKVLQLRKQLQKEGIKLSVNDFIIKAVAQTLRQIPQVNSVWQGGAVEQVKTIDVSIAVATEGGLITPIVKDTAGKGLSQIRDEVRELASRARDGKLKPEEFQGGTFTISNLGMFGIREFTAVINPPQTCIMAVGGTRLLSASAPIDLDADDKVADDVKRDVDSVMTVTLSSDARVVDDELASRFLHEFKRNVENPMMLGLL